MEGVGADRTTRRGLLQHLIKQSGSTAATVVGLQLPTATATAPPAPSRTIAAERPLAPAIGTSRAASLAELSEMAERLGLGARTSDVADLARFSARLVTDAPPDRVGSRRREAAAGTEPAPLLRVDLADVARAIPAPAELPVEGVLSIVDGRSEATLQTAPSREVTVAVRDRARAAHPGDERFAAPSAELMLPRVWSAAVEALGLSGDERAAWEQLRSELAALQGVEPFDLEPEPRALHRLLGLPDDRGGWMPVSCAMFVAGVDMGGEPPAAHPRAAEFRPAAAAWRLLAQVTFAPGPEGEGARRGERLFLWAHRDDLDRADFSGVLAIQR
ncbi:MAG: hypothetical protein ACOYD4_01895 [Solirubrobacterales bacterium]